MNANQKDPTMLDEKTIHHFFNLINQRDLDTLLAILAEDAEFYFPKTQPLLGRNRILKFFKLLFKQYPELTFEIKRIIIQGGNAAVHWTNEGLSRKGDDYRNEGVTLFETETGEGTIRWISDFFKDTTIF